MTAVQHGRGVGEASQERALLVAELLNEIAVSAAAELDLNGILAAALERLHLLLEFTGGSIAVVEDNDLVVRAAVGPYASAGLGQRIPRGRTRGWQVVLEAQPYLASDLPADDDRATTPIRTYLAVPLCWREHAFGLLEVTSTKPEAFTEDDVALVQRIATAISGPIELARRATSEAHARAEAESALRARDVFLGIAAHELKTPVTSMRGYAQLMLRTLDRQGSIAPDRLRQAMMTIDQQAEKLGRLMTQLLDVTRLDAGRFVLDYAPTDLVHLARETIAAVQLHAKQHHLRVLVQGVPQPALPSVLARAESAQGATADEGGATESRTERSGPIEAEVDAARVGQVLSNLLDNALKFSPADSTIDVEVALPSPKQVQLAVRDHGPGVPEEQRTWIFQRFHQANGEGYRGGMGLGLYLSRQIARMHGGRLDAEFPSDGGSRFILTLPRFPHLAAQAPAPALAVSPTTANEVLDAGPTTTSGSAGERSTSHG